MFNAGHNTSNTHYAQNGTWRSGAPFGGIEVDPVSVGLVLFSIVLFTVTLFLSIKPSQELQLQQEFGSPQKASPHNQTGNPAKASLEENKQNTIILKLPENENYAGNYKIDLIVSLNKKNEQKESNIAEQKKKHYRRLDEYF